MQCQHNYRKYHQGSVKAYTRKNDSNIYYLCETCAKAWNRKHPDDPITKY